MKVKAKIEVDIFALIVILCSRFQIIKHFFGDNHGRSSIKMTSKLIVAKDNQLIHASYELTISEQRVILLCLAKIDSRQELPLNFDFTISVDNMAEHTGADKANAYRDLKKAVDSLYARTICIDPTREMRWLYQKAFFKSKGVAVISLSPSIFPFLFELKKRFTTYRLSDVAKFKCSYSIRFYELLMQFKKNDRLSVDVEWVRNALQLGEKYPRTADIKKYVVLPAIADINNFSNLSVTFEQEKRGREISNFIIHYRLKSGVKENALTDDYVSKNARPGESWDDARTRLSQQKALT